VVDRQARGVWNRHWNRRRGLGAAASTMSALETGPEKELPWCARAAAAGAVKEWPSLAMASVAGIAEERPLLAMADAAITAEQPRRRRRGRAEVAVAAERPWRGREDAAVAAEDPWLARADAAVAAAARRVTRRGTGGGAWLSSGSWSMAHDLQRARHC
jgi:hypothetical protein